jgi:hypothetical protein
MNIWLVWFNSYDKKARTADNSGSGSNPGSDPDPNLDLSYETELEFGFETMNVSEKDRKDLAA